MEENADLKVLQPKGFKSYLLHEIGNIWYHVPDWSVKLKT